MDKLLKLPVCSNERTSSLRFVFDKINAHIRGLMSLGVAPDQYGSLLIPIIMTKLPSDVRLRIARQSEEEVWKIEDLLEVIKLEVEGRESSEGNRVNPQRSQTCTPNPRCTNHSNSTASSLFTSSGKVQCVYCGKDHFSASCSKISSVTDRKSILLKSGRCFNSLRTNHKSRDCSSPKNCRFCDRRHHQSICEARAENPTPNAENPTSNAENPTSNTESNAVTNTANGLKGKCTILLQTAQAIATNESARTSRKVRVLFDSGRSQRSYITEKLQSQLHLKPIRCEKLSLNTFRDNQFKSQSRSVFKLYLCIPGSQEKLKLWS